MSTSSIDTQAGPMSVADRAYADLHQRILDNVMPAGYQAFEQEIADMLQISRTPVREALNRLAADGLIDLRPRRGMRVLPVSAADMREIYEVLTALESMAAEIVARRGVTDDEARQLADSVAAMERALRGGDLRVWAQADERFHLMLVRLCGNRRLAAQVATFWAQSHRARLLTLKLRPVPTRSNEDHRAVVEAILAGDADRAGTLHRDHRLRTGSLLLSILEKYDLTAL